MDKGKGVRKYSRGKQALRWGKYVAHESTLIPVVVAAGIAFLVGCFGIVAASALMLICLFAPDNAGDASFDLFILVTSSVLAVPSGLFLKEYIKAPVGNV